MFFGIRKKNLILCSNRENARNDMKTNSFKRLWGVVLGLALLAAVPFAAQAQTKAPPESEEVTLTLEGTFCGYGTFTFEGQTIRYKHSKDEYPTKVKIDGVPWDDLSEPFKLNYTPDFAHAAIVEKQARNIVELMPFEKSFILRINDHDIPAAYYRIKIAVKDQIKRQPPSPVNLNALRREPTMREIMDMEEKTAKMSKNWGPPINEPTDGMDHPDYAISKAVPKRINERLIQIKGTVDQWACFRIQGNSVVYQNYTTPVLGVSGDGSPMLHGGKFASGVTVNGKSWDNLTKPFDLGFTPSSSASKDIVFKAEQCEIEYAHHDDVFEITITNKSKNPAPFQVLFGIGYSPATQRNPVRAFADDRYKSKE